MIRERGHHHFDHISADSFEGFGNIAENGATIYVDTVNGHDTASGKNWTRALKTMEEAFERVASNGIIAVVGTIAEQEVVAPLGVYGVRVVGMAGGNTRHDGTFPRWKQSAVAENKDLVIIREQGWEFHNILFVPESGYGAIKAWRAEDAVHPDSGHFKVRRCKFIGPGGIGTPQGYGIVDFGGNHHYIVEDCEFNDLDTAIIGGTPGDPGIAAPLRNRIQKNLFGGNKNDIYFNASRCVIEGNVFQTLYHAANHPNTVNLAPTADPGTGNHVLKNFFQDATADVTIAKGYVPCALDIWRNYVADAAAEVVALPV